MPKLEFPVLSEGLLVDVLIGLDGATTTALVAAGQPVAAPIRARGEIDTGCNVSRQWSGSNHRLARNCFIARTTGASPYLCETNETKGVRNLNELVRS